MLNCLDLALSLQLVVLARLEEFDFHSVGLLLPLKHLVLYILLHLLYFAPSCLYVSGYLHQILPKVSLLQFLGFNLILLPLIDHLKVFAFFLVGFQFLE